MRTLITISLFLIFTSCGTSVKKDVSTDRYELLPEPDKDLREAYEKKNKLFGYWRFTTHMVIDSLGTELNNMSAMELGISVTRKQICTVFGN